MLHTYIVGFVRSDAVLVSSKTETETEGVILTLSKGNMPLRLAVSEVERAHYKLEPALIMDFRQTNNESVVGVKMASKSLGRFISLASLVIGIVGLGAWLVPFIGGALALSGLALGIGGSDTDHRPTAIVGILLCTIGLGLTIYQFVTAGPMGIFN